MTDKQPEALRLADLLENEKHVTDLALFKAAAELRRLQKMEQAYYEWIEKTEWVQESCAAEELGMHRADVMKQRIDRLHEVNAELVEALKAFDDAAKDSKSIIGFSGKALPLLKKARAAIAKATGEQQ